MKKVMLNAAIFASAMFFTLSCSDKRASENDDSKEVAKEENDAKFDDTEIEGDTKFAVSAADGAMLEIQLGQLAQDKGVSQQVKDLGKMIANDHMKGHEELSALAQQKNISLPATMSEECQKKYDKIAEKNGQEFDEAFTEFAVKDHKDDIDAFKKEAEKGDDPDLKAWAAGKVATLEHHLDMAKAAEEAVDNNKRTGKLK
jgi:putative membrane protein